MGGSDFDGLDGADFDPKKGKGEGEGKGEGN